THFDHGCGRDRRRGNFIFARNVLLVPSDDHIGRISDQSVHFEVFRLLGRSLYKEETRTVQGECPGQFSLCRSYFWMEATAPAPTVRPPSRIEKRVPSS